MSDNAELTATPQLPPDTPPHLTLAICQSSQPSLTAHLHLDALHSDLLQEHGLQLMTVETQSLEFKPLPSKTLLLLQPVPMISAFSHQMETTIVSIPPVLTSSTILMPVELPVTCTITIVPMPMVTLLDVSVKETNSVSEPTPITCLTPDTPSHSLSPMPVEILPFRLSTSTFPMQPLLNHAEIPLYAFPTALKKDVKEITLT